MPESNMVGHVFEIELNHFISTPAEQKYISLSFPTSMIWTAFDFTNLEQSDPYKTTFDGMTQPLAAYAYAQIELEMATGGSPTVPISDSMSIKNMTMCSQGFCLRDYEISMQNGQASIQTMNIDFGKMINYTVTSGKWAHEVATSWAPNNKSKAAFISNWNLQAVPQSSRGYFPINFTTLYKNETGKWTQENVTDEDDDSPILSRMNSIGFERMISNIAASFTQMTLELSNDTFNGTVHGSEVFVSVQWYWLILPTLLMVTGTIFFAATVLVNRRAKMPLWKSSALAPLFHGLDKVGEGHFMCTSEMEKTAKGVEVQLKDAEGYGRLMLREKND